VRNLGVEAFRKPENLDAQNRECLIANRSDCPKNPAASRTDAGRVFSKKGKVAFFTTAQ
jgi:hypothetical protein